MTAADGFPVRVDFERILETIAARIYDNQFAFLRENVQNAIDAIRIQARRQAIPSDDPRFRIDIQVTPTTTTISDNGVGMSREELIQNFWTMGASGKNTPEARAAGCIGTFGIGGFANFGVCRSLTVVSRSNRCTDAHRTSLSRASFGNDRFNLPKVDYSVDGERTERGTTVIGEGDQPFDSVGMRAYLQQFVSHVREAVYYNGEKLSQNDFSAPREGRRLQAYVQSGDLASFQLYADSDGGLAAELIALTTSEGESQCRGYVRLVGSGLEVSKRGFKLCSVNVPSTIGVSGWIDSDLLRPTAGRDSLDGASTNLLTRVFQIIEERASEHIVGDSDLLGSHIRLIPDLLRRGKLGQLGLLRVPLVDGRETTLQELLPVSGMERRIFYSNSNVKTAATEALSARGHVVVRVSGNSQRRRAEVMYLTKFCSAQELDGLLECLETYTDLDAFEKSVLNELTYSMKRLFNPPEFVLVAGKLTLDVPIYWSGKGDGARVLVYVDTRHGEIQKLRPLGYTSMFWSMVEAFCREYLTETLRRQAPKLFGKGAIDLDALSKANSELWELVIGDIAVSKLGTQSAGRGSGRVEVVRRGDIGRVTISGGGTTTDVGSAKILHVIDQSGLTALSGFYLRIPDSAAAAFGDIIRRFNNYAVVWFANRVTWQGSDLETVAFLLDVTLDRLVVGADGKSAHGAVELQPSQLQTHGGHLFIYIPQELEEHLVPREAQDLIRIQVRHELVDMNRPRSWTSKG